MTAFLPSPGRPWPKSPIGVRTVPYPWATWQEFMERNGGSESLRAELGTHPMTTDRPEAVHGREALELGLDTVN